ncbi:ATP-dependent helicase [Rhizobium lusitanum]|uniref:ATP-dependent helicase n=1 Tax=Rhizobium lusitanum TaxID=293958 RepID=A0A6L9U919_9HYPH|nr:ATP-dependent helicase [Rhizobium lusitanum]
MNAAEAPYGRLQLDGDRWVLSDVPPHVAIRLKNMFQRISKTQTKMFTLPASNEMSADLAWFMERYPFEMSASDARFLKRRVRSFNDDRASTEAILLPGWQAPPIRGFRPGRGLRFHQAQAFELVKRRGSLLLGDDVGFGKTWVAMARAMERRPAAVVVQSHLATQWVNKFIVPNTELTAHIIDGTQPYSLPAADTYIFRYSNIHGWTDVAATGYFKLVAYDEIQDLRTGDTSEKGRAARVFSENAEERLGLSATPVFNYGSEIWSIMSYIDADLLGPWEEFIREWCHMGAGGKWMVTDPDALGSYLREAGAFLRRVRDGRPINRIVVDVAYDHGEAAKTEDLARQLAMKVVEGSFGESGQAARELDALARRVTGMAKAKGVAAYAKILLSSGIPIILAGWHRDVYQIWLDELKEFKPLMYTGSETGRQKDKAVAAYLRRESDCFIISLRSGAGLDGLQERCATVIVGELDWSPQIYEQLFGRVDREGQKQTEITAIFCTCDFGSDPTIMSVNAVKRDQARGITDPGVGIIPVHTDVSHIKLLAQEYLERSNA